MSKLKNKSLSQLKKELDRVFSLYIRRRDGYRCFTCGKQLVLETSQNGHFISRSHHSLRWDEENCHCQCAGCNIFKNGNMPAYAVALEMKYGYGIIQKLHKLGNKTKQMKKDQLIELILLYKD